ncbi:hypothetical protein [Dryocola sp. LX212]|jgi:hypothetical protein
MKANIAQTLFVLAGLVSLQGCVSKPIEPLSGPNTVTSAELSVQNSPRKEDWLQTCLYETSQLVEISPQKYTEKKEQLYQNIREAKYFASVAPHVSADTKMVMTPYYQYKLYDICTELSHDMYNELKAGKFPAKEK